MSPEVSEERGPSKAESWDLGPGVRSDYPARPIMNIPLCALPPSSCRQEAPEIETRRPAPGTETASQTPRPPRHGTASSSSVSHRRRRVASLNNVNVDFGPG